MLREIDRGRPLSDAERALLRGLVTACAEQRGAPSQGQTPKAQGLTPNAQRQVVMEELARQDPALSVLVARHFLACDLLAAYGGEAARALLEEWRAGRRITTVAHAAWPAPGATSDKAPVSGVVERVFGGLADDVLIVTVAGQAADAGGGATSADGLYVFRRDDPALEWEPRPQLGLHAAGVGRMTLTGVVPTLAVGLPEGTPGADAMRAFGFPKLAAIALGAADRLLERSLEYADTRVQFPGLFRDEQGRDTILKFGAIKQMLSEIEARRLLLETLAEAAPMAAPTDQASLTAKVAKVLVSEAIGTDVGTISYNAFQVFGGLSFSAHDILEKYYRDSAEFLFLLGTDRALKIEIGRALQEGIEALFPADGDAARGPLAEVAAIYHSGVTRLRQACDTAGPDLTEVTAGVLADEALALVRLRVLMQRARARLEGGLPAMRDVEAARLFAREIQARGTTIPIAERNAWGATAESLGAATFSDGTWEQRVPEPEPASYAATLEAQPEYTHGDFLLAPREDATPRYCPEHVLADAGLRAEYGRLRQLFTERYRERLWDGLPYPRMLERLHRLPPEELAFLHAQGFMRRTIPVEFGGEGRLKAEYYLLTYLVARLGDFSTALTIQVNSTLGSLPLLHGLEEARRERQKAEGGRQKAEHERRRAEGETPKAQGPTPNAHVEELRRREEAVEQMLRRVAAGEMTAFGLTEPGAGSDTARLATRAAGPFRAEVHTDADGVKYFLPGEAAGAAAAEGARRNLLDARRLLLDNGRLLYRYDDAEPPAEIHDEEYDYETDAPGRYRYYLHRGRRVDIHDIAQIRAEEGREYYEYYEIAGSKLWITNSRWAKLMCVYARTEAGITAFGVDRHAEGLVVGADEEKMGQHGSVTSALSFDRVRVPRENILGLEGRGQQNALSTLTMGRLGLSLSCIALMQDVLDGVRSRMVDEEKDTGRNPPTWARERMGAIAAEVFACEALVYDLIGRADSPHTKSLRVEGAVAKYYASEALQRVVRAAEEIEGPASHDAAHALEKMKRDTRIITVYEGSNQVQRLAILRALQSDVLPRFRQSGVQVFRYSGVQDTETVEGAVSRIPEHLHPLRGYPARTPEHLNTLLLSALDEADRIFGESLYTNPNFQPMAFLLSEIAAEILVMQCTAGRAAWVRAHVADREYQRYAEEAARWVCARGAGEIAARMTRFREMLDQARAGLYPPEVRLATLLTHVDRPAADGTRDAAVGVTVQAQDAGAPLEIAVLVKATPKLSPRPRLEDGQLLEPGWGLDPAAAAALDAALRLKAEHAAGTRVTALALGPAHAAETLRHALALGADDAVWVTGTAEDAAAVAGGLARALRERAAGTGRQPDLVLAGEAALDTGRALVPALLAAELGWECLRAGDEIALTPGWTLRRDDASVPAPLVLTLPAAEEIPEFTLEGFLRAMASELTVLPGIVSVREAEPAAAPYRYALPEGAGDDASSAHTAGTRTSPEEAARALLEQLGLSANGTGRAPYRGTIATVDRLPEIGTDGGALYYLPRPPGEPGSCEWPREAREGLDAAAGLAAALGLPLAVVALVAEEDETRLRELTAPLLAVAPAVVLLAASPALAAASERGYREAISQLLGEHASRPGNGAATTGAWIVSTEWAHGVLARLSHAPGVPPAGDRTFHSRVKEIREANGGLVLARAVFGGRLRAAEWVPKPAPGNGACHYVTLDAGSRFTAGGEDGTRRRGSDTGSEPAVYHVRLALVYDRKADSLPPLVAPPPARRAPSPPRAGLRDAECVLDVGYGIGSRDNLDRLVLPLKRLLEAAGARRVAIGGTRRVTEELKLMPADAQIGQTGTPVNPAALIALGVSGAPQHLDYIGDRGIVLAFNRDPDAPIMTLNDMRSAPRVYPVVGDLFETLPRFTAALRRAAGLPEAAPPSLSGPSVQEDGR
jgi:alkylation response protein AidB-like acyl-CoA dehydrogenase/electron transfer flavoprotein alpha/beta subunit